MNIDDFRCIRNGVQLYPLSDKDAALLRPIEKKNNNYNSALLLFHGFTSTPAVFRNLIPALKHYDAIICPALAGHVKTIDAFSQTKASSWIDQAEEACRALMSEYKQVDVLGLSLGGLLACHLSKLFSLHHLYLLAPALDLQVSTKNILKLAYWLSRFGFSRIPNLAGNLYGTEHCEIAYRQVPLSVIIEILTLIQQFQFVVPTCPTDLFLGEHDKVVSSWRVADRFAGHKNITLHWLSQSAHVLPLDNDLQTIINCISHKCHDKIIY